MLAYIPAPWIRHGLSTVGLRGPVGFSTCCDFDSPSQGARLTAAAHPSDTAGKPNAPGHVRAYSSGTRTC